GTLGPGISTRGDDVSWNFGDVFEAVAAAVPDAPAQIQGDLVRTWGEFDRRANALATDLLDAGLGQQSKVGIYLYNCPEYFEVVQGSFKAAMVPFNTNYRYGPDEVAYLFDNADAEAVVFHTSFAELIDRIRGELPAVRRWYAIDDTGSGIPPWAFDYQALVAEGADRVVPPWGRSGDDILMLYTGGTTGMPKGVMWRQDDLFTVLGRGGNALVGTAPAETLDDIAERATGGVSLLVACPMMHGTGQFSAFGIMQLGGAVVALPSRHFDPAELWRVVDERSVNVLSIVGDAFAKPMLAELDANRDRYDLSSVLAMISSGVMWSQEVKNGLIGHIPQVTLSDNFASSEALGMGASVSSADRTESTAKFRVGPRCKVFTDDDREVQPGSGEAGMVAVGGAIPLGYYKDEAKTAATFRTVDGVRYSIPGDWATVNEDGTLNLLGRGSVCINTGGEKVYPEEVEEALKRHPTVNDAVCVAVPDERFGEAICAVVEPAAGQTPTLDDLSAHVKAGLASYKAPRHLVVVETIGRAVNGKVDYKRLTTHAREVVGTG
ncbi:MAG: acyl-CoA synthetase, partial [Acidimicrobiales bacterium]